MTHSRESWHTYECVTRKSHSTHIQMSHATTQTSPPTITAWLECISHITHKHGSCHVGHGTLTWRSHGAHMNESWHTYEWVITPHKRRLPLSLHDWNESVTSHVVVSHTRISHGTHRNQLGYHAHNTFHCYHDWYQSVTSHKRTSHGTYRNQWGYHADNAFHCYCD